MPHRRARDPGEHPGRGAGGAKKESGEDSDLRDGPAALASFLDSSGTEVRDAFRTDALAAAVRLMSKYADIPMDFPDATLVWLAESSGTDKILTFDRRGFLSFRFGKNRRFELLLDL